MILLLGALAWAILLGGSVLSKKHKDEAYIVGFLAGILVTMCVLAMVPDSF